MFFLSHRLLLNLLDLDSAPNFVIEGQLLDQFSHELLLSSDDIRYIVIVHILVDFAFVDDGFHSPDIEKTLMFMSFGPKEMCKRYF